MKTRRNVRRVTQGAALILAGVLASGPLAGAPAAATEEGEGQAADPLRIEVTLDEYSFAQDPLRLPAGRPITLVIRNAGQVPHEFMAGRQAVGDDFAEDLFADLYVNIESEGTQPGEHSGASAAGHDHRSHGADLQRSLAEASRRRPRAADRTTAAVA